MSSVSRAAMHCRLAVGIKGFITLGPVAATTGKARPHPRGFSLKSILAIRHGGLAGEEAWMRRVGTVARCDRGRFGPRKEVWWARAEKFVARTGHAEVLFLT